MKRKLFLLNMFLSTSLLGGTVFDVISCKKAVKSGDESNEKTEVTIKEKVALIKQKAKAIIDDYTTNSKNKENKNWIIDLQQIKYSEDKIKVLRDAVKNMKESEEGKLVSQTDSFLNEIINEKVKQISRYVTAKLKLDKKLDLPNDFKIEINDNFEPVLANFTTIKFVQAVKKLLSAKLIDTVLNQANSSFKTYQNFIENNDSKNPTEKIDSLVKPDIFKINTDFSYSFNYAGINETDVYKNVEILATNNVFDTKDLKDYTHQQLEKIFNELIEKNVLIYDGDKSNKNISGQKRENLNIKFNWNFNDVQVQNEIRDIQFQKLRSAINNNPVLKSVNFDPEEIKYDSVGAINFSNESIKKPLSIVPPTTNLAYGFENDIKINSFSNIKTVLLRQWGIIEKEKSSFGSEEEFYFNSDHEGKYWDGGILNWPYFEKLKEDERIEEFYNKKTGQYLIGYGNLSIPGIDFASLTLDPLKIKTNITIYETGFSYMMSSLLKYLEGLVSVLQNNGQVGKPGYTVTNVHNDYEYRMQWKFYDNEWTAIEKEMESKNQVSFSWIMENIIYKLRASNSKQGSAHNILELEQYWKDDAIPKEAIESFRATDEILFVESSEKKLEMVKPNNDYAVWHFKFGPFKIFLSDKHSRYGYSWSEAVETFTDKIVVKG